MAGMEVKVDTMNLTPNQEPQPILSVKFIPVAIAALVVTWSFGWLYMGETWDPASKTPNIQVGIMNCDNGIPSNVTAALPPSFTESPVFKELARQPFATTLLNSSVWNPNSPASEILFWRHVTCSRNYSSGPGCGIYSDACFQEAMDRIMDGDFWIVWFFPGNFSESALSWYNPTRGVYPKAYTAQSRQIYARGRSFTTLSYSLAPFNAVWNGIKDTTFANVARVSAFYRAQGVEIVDYTVLNQPMTATPTDLAPVLKFGQHMASYIFCLLTWLGATFCVAVFNQYKSPIEIYKLLGGTVTKVQIFGAMGVKALAAIFYMFILSILMVCILWSLGRGNIQFYGHNAGYCIAFIWWLSFCNISMNTCLLYMLGADKFSSISAFMLVLQLTSGGAIFSDELSPSFFQIGHGLPFYYGVRGLRTIFFGPMQNVMWANWLIIFGWNVGSTFIAFLLTITKISKMTSIPPGAAAPVVIAVAA